jgi:hypothetical protein
MLFNGREVGIQIKEEPFDSGELSFMERRQAFAHGTEQANLKANKKRI